MTLELNEILPQIKAMGHSLSNQSVTRDSLKIKMQSLLHQYSTAYTELSDRILQAETVQQQQRFNWVGAAPVNEPLAQAYPLPAQSERVTVIASDGSQILPDRHAITLYYLINVGSIIYRHGSNLKPEVYNPKPQLCYKPDELLDEQGRIIAMSEVNVKRDLAELEAVMTLASSRAYQYDEPVIGLVDGPLTLRVIDLPFKRQQACQQQYLTMLDTLRDNKALLGAYIDRPRSTFVVSLMHLASLEQEQITEEHLRQNEFRYLTDLDLFEPLLAPGERTAIFSMKAKGLEKYTKTGHAVHFFYLNVGRAARPNLARVEIPAWMMADARQIDILHATLVRQARLAGDYPYVLARAHELAIISNEEREAVEMMLAVEMRRQGLNPKLSTKQTNKNLLGEREGFSFYRSR